MYDNLSSYFIFATGRKVKKNDRRSRSDAAVQSSTAVITATYTHTLTSDLGSEMYFHVTRVKYLLP
eukprot:1957572-Amphidinium_carterae.1